MPACEWCRARDRGGAPGSASFSCASVPPASFHVLSGFAGVRRPCTPWPSWQAWSRKTLLGAFAAHVAADTAWPRPRTKTSRSSRAPTRCARRVDNEQSTPEICEHLRPVAKPGRTLRMIFESMQCKPRFDVSDDSFNDQATLSQDLFDLFCSIW